MDWQADSHIRMKLARAYVLPQAYAERFNPPDGLRHGTIFPELLMPYVPEEAKPSEERSDAK